MNAEQLIQQAHTTATRLFDEPGAEGKAKDHEIELLRTRLREVVAVVNKQTTATLPQGDFIAGTTIP